MEIVSKVNSNKFSKLTAYKYISRFLNKKEKIELNGFDDTTVFSIQKYKKGKNILKKDIKIYINNIPYQINPDLYEYYGTAGTIKLNYPSMLINTIQVKISKKTFFSFLSNKVSAVTKKYENMNIAAELSSEPSLSVNQQFTIQGVPIAYNTTGGYMVTIMLKKIGIQQMIVHYMKNVKMANVNLMKVSKIILLQI